MCKKLILSQMTMIDDDLAHKNIAKKITQSTGLIACVQHESGDIFTQYLQTYSAL